MRRSFAVSFVIFLFGCSHAAPDGASQAAGLVSDADGARHIVTVALDDWSGDMQWLHENGFDVAGVSIPHQRADVVVSATGLAALKARGMSIMSDRDATAAPFTDEDDLDTPDTPDAKYQTPTRIATKLNAYAAAHPDIAHVQSIGKSLEGRDILAIEITRNVAEHSPTKPAILFNGSHHARELMSTEVPLDTIDYLLKNDGKIAKITHYIDANDIWIVPMFNVDGNNRVWTNDALWRKNTRGCKAGVKCASGTGVDINRNYSYAWASCDGSSTDPTADDYHGTAADSEPETLELQSLVDKIRPVFDISYHSYSELVLYPGGCQGVFTPQKALFQSIGAKMAALLPLDEGKGNYAAGTPWELLYSVDGDDIDWMYYTYNTFAFAIELNGDEQGFQPSYAKWRNKTVIKLRPAWEVLFDQLDASGVRGVLTGGAAAAGTTAELTTTTGTKVVQKHAVNPDGSFHFLVAPGSFQLHVSAPGHAAVDQTVTVAASRVNLAIPW